MKITVLLNYWAIGGAENGYKRLAAALPQYEWKFATELTEPTDVVIYSNDHRFYEQAKALKIPKIIQRTTGKRSHGLPQPDDLHALVCSSQEAFDKSEHPRKVMIYNGVDISRLQWLRPIACDLLYAPARVGVGQRVSVAAEWARVNNRHLTCLGSRQHLDENTYEELQQQYPEVNWVGLVNPTKATRYIAGCKDYICPTPNHGVSNAIIEAVALGKCIINLGGVEVPCIEGIDINLMKRKWYKILMGDE